VRARRTMIVLGVWIKPQPSHTVINHKPHL
jgi:hypothetical protein